MIKPNMLQPGDRVAIVSLSSGMLGDASCRHNMEIGVRRLRGFGLEPVFMPNALKGIDYLSRHPDKRAEDLKRAFLDESIRGVICAIGGDDTYRLLPYLMEDGEFIQAVQRSPKLFTGFSDTTVNHFMFHRIGMQTFYGPCFLCDLGEIANDMLPYTKAAFEGYFRDYKTWKIRPSDVWYEERTDWSPAAIGTPRTAHPNEGFLLLQGSPVFQGKILGGCLEVLYDIFDNSRYADSVSMCEKYELFPPKEDWAGKILLLETCEEQPVPQLYRKMVQTLKKTGIFEVISGIICGKPMDELYFEEYKKILVEEVADPTLPIVANVNIGHATPRCIIPFGVDAVVDANRQQITFSYEDK